MKWIFAIFFTITLSFHSFADYISGKITDNSGHPLAFANVYIKNTSYGVSSNNYGNYFLELKAGHYTIIYSYIGYESVEKEVDIIAGQPLIINVQMKELPQTLGEVVVGAQKVDKAKMIMQKVREKRKEYFENVRSYQCKTYLKTSIEKELVKPPKADSLNRDSVQLETEDMGSILKKEKMNLIEAISTTWYESPSLYREEILAYKDYTEKKSDFNYTVSYGMSYGKEDIVPGNIIDENPNILYKDILSSDLNFYNNMISFPAVSQDLFTSPLASTSGLNYQFEFLGSFYENGKLIYKISVEPIFKTEALFSGTIFIEDSTWALKAVDLSINKLSMSCCREVKVIQNYEEIQSGIYLPVRRELIYTIRDEKYYILGNTRVNHTDYVLNQEQDHRLFFTEVKKYAPEAFDKDSVYWKENRPLHLKNEELEFIKKSDSMSAYFATEEYLHKKDSVFNRVHFWIWLTGVGHRNRAKGTEWYVSGLPEQVQLLGIGGYRHKLPFYFNKEFKNGMKLETRNFIDYGFGNQDVKGSIRVGLTYLPLKFMRTSIEVGDIYDMINTYSSFEQIFSMSNYVRKRTFSISQRMEIINGLYAELTFDFSNQDPINDLKLSWWSEYLFGKLNTPVEFERYIKSEIRLELHYLIRQKYFIRDNRKIILGTNYPEFLLIYRKGIPELFKSEVNYDYLELASFGYFKFKHFGRSSWNVTAASFLNKKSLRTLEYKYFRGSDVGIFSDPLQSFQLLGPTFLTSNAYFRASYFHHFENAIINKIPLLNRTKLQLAGGAGFMTIPSENFLHVELYAGIERVFKIKRQLFRIGVYAVTSETNISEADYTFKFGLDFFNPYRDKWNY